MDSSEKNLDKGKGISSSNNETSSSSMSGVKRNREDLGYDRIGVDGNGVGNSNLAVGGSSIDQGGAYRGVMNTKVGFDIFGGMDLSCVVEGLPGETVGSHRPTKILAGEAGACSGGIVTATGQGAYQCLFCGENIIDRAQLGVHMASHANEAVRIIELIGDLEGETLTAFRETFSQHRSSGNEKSKAKWNRGVAEIGYLITCPYCMKTFRSAQGYGSHKNSCPKRPNVEADCGKQHICENCNMIFSNIYALSGHMNKKACRKMGYGLGKSSGKAGRSGASHYGVVSSNVAMTGQVGSSLGGQAATESGPGLHAAPLHVCEHCSQRFNDSAGLAGHHCNREAREAKEAGEDDEN